MCRTPVRFDVEKSCSRSRIGTSCSVPLIVDCLLSLRPTASRFWRASDADIGDLSEATTLRIDVPIRMRSPSLRRVFLIFSPLTNVPFVEPRSMITIWPPLVEIFACLRDTMSSTRTMSRSEDRPTTISRSGRSGNSPPWYLPEMNLRAYCISADPLFRPWAMFKHTQVHLGALVLWIPLEHLLKGFPGVFVLTFAMEEQPEVKIGRQMVLVVEQ